MADENCFGFGMTTLYGQGLCILIDNLSESQPIVLHLSCSGIIGTAIPYEVWDHSYVSLKSNQEKSDSTLVGKSQPSSSESLKMNSSQNENCKS